MLDYAVRLTRDPAAVTEDDVGGLRAAGFTDRAILDICQVTAYYAYVNRLADGLGVGLEPWWKDDELTISKAELEEARSRRRA
jgi:uncharacterized peroxidase-related enzyme